VLATPGESGLARGLHQVIIAMVDQPMFWRRHMSWTKPEYEVVELGMEVGAYAGNA
jgi:coenzyme PQQ precursor peptide PqqA